MITTTTKKAEAFLDLRGLQAKEYSEPMHTDFRDQLQCSEEDWYQTGLIWKPNVPDLPNNQ